MGSRIRPLIVALVTAVVVYLIFAAAVFAAQRSMMYPAPTQGPPPEHWERLGITQTGSLRVLRRPGTPVVVHFHGNGEQLGHVAALADDLHRRGVGFLAVEYPGYAGVPGAPTEDSLYAAAEAALATVPPEEVVLSGQSLGTGVAVEMARRGHGRRLLLLAPFTSIADVARRDFGWLPVELLVRDRFDSRQKASQVRIPVLIVHGDRDAVIPVEHGRALARQFPRATLLEVEAAGHNDLLDCGGERLLDALASFARGD